MYAHCQAKDKLMNPTSLPKKSGYAGFKLVCSKVKSISSYTMLINEGPGVTTGSIQTIVRGEHAPLEVNIGGEAKSNNDASHILFHLISNVNNIEHYHTPAQTSSVFCTCACSKP